MAQIGTESPGQYRTPCERSSRLGMCLIRRTLLLAVMESLRNSRPVGRNHRDYHPTGAISSREWLLSPKCTEKTIEHLCRTVPVPYRHGEGFLRSPCLLLPDWAPHNPDLNPAERVWSVAPARLRRAARLPGSVEGDHRASAGPARSRSFGQVVDELHELPADAHCRQRTQYFAILVVALCLNMPADGSPGADFCPFSTDEENFILACVNHSSNKWADIVHMLGERFGPCDHFGMMH
jgi:hypothetical protein